MELGHTLDGAGYSGTSGVTFEDTQGYPVSLADGVFVPPPSVSRMHVLGYAANTVYLFEADTGMCVWETDLSPYYSQVVEAGRIRRLVRAKAGQLHRVVWTRCGVVVGVQSAKGAFVMVLDTLSGIPRCAMNLVVPSAVTCACVGTSGNTVMVGTESGDVLEIPGFPEDAEEPEEQGMVVLDPVHYPSRVHLPAPISLLCPTVLGCAGAVRSLSAEVSPLHLSILPTDIPIAYAPLPSPCVLVTTPTEGHMAVSREGRVPISRSPLSAHLMSLAYELDGSDVHGAMFSVGGVSSPVPSVSADAKKARHEATFPVAVLLSDTHSPLSMVPAQRDGHRGVICAGVAEEVVVRHRVGIDDVGMDQAMGADTEGDLSMSTVLQCLAPLDDLPLAVSCHCPVLHRSGVSRQCLLSPDAAMLQSLASPSTSPSLPPLVSLPGVLSQAGLMTLEPLRRGHASTHPEDWEGDAFAVGVACMLLCGGDGGEAGQGRALLSRLVSGRDRDGAFSCPNIRPLHRALRTLLQCLTSWVQQGGLDTLAGTDVDAPCPHLSLAVSAGWLVSMLIEERESASTSLHTLRSRFECLAMSIHTLRAEGAQASLPLHASEAVAEVVRGWCACSDPSTLAPCPPPSDIPDTLPSVEACIASLASCSLPPTQASVSLSALARGAALDRRGLVPVPLALLLCCGVSHSHAASLVARVGLPSREAEAVLQWAGIVRLAEGRGEEVSDDDVVVPTLLPPLPNAADRAPLVCAVAVSLLARGMPTAANATLRLLSDSRTATPSSDVSLGVWAALPCWSVTELRVRLLQAAHRLPEALAVCREWVNTALHPYGDASPDVREVGRALSVYFAVGLDGPEARRLFTSCLSASHAGVLPLYCVARPRVCHVPCVTAMCRGDIPRAVALYRYAVQGLADRRLPTPTPLARTGTLVSARLASVPALGGVWARSEVTQGVCVESVDAYIAEECEREVETKGMWDSDTQTEGVTDSVTQSQMDRTARHTDRVRQSGRVGAPTPSVRPTHMSFAAQAAIATTHKLNTPAAGLAYAAMRGLQTPGVMLCTPCLGGLAGARGGMGHSRMLTAARTMELTASQSCSDWDGANSDTTPEVTEATELTESVTDVGRTVTWGATPRPFGASATGASHAYGASTMGAVSTPVSVAAGVPVHRPTPGSTYGASAPTSDGGEGMGSMAQAPPGGMPFMTPFTFNNASPLPAVSPFATSPVLPPIPRMGMTSPSVAPPTMPPAAQTQSLKRPGSNLPGRRSSLRSSYMVE
ncbi:hypothetical protein KIPB_002017 [Kipferlia bialata]|uniref:Uncharacterized protein n=1 Tax=Kipferlia bialata TaxID=797122 RepID=A0A9K3CRH8_9EUKA|nr:hypothetical protein KIPB_002017 [Kipferlia bialata]|eukprot:g2017.t1